MRRRGTGAPTSAANGRDGGGATYGSPGIAPAVASSSAAASRTERVTMNSAEKPLQRSPSPGPNEFRPRDGLRPTSAQWLAGMRIDPPPSLACATGTRPAATAAAAPPLEPPGLCAGFHGLRVGPNAIGSVVGRSASSGVFVRPSDTSPAAASFRVRYASSFSRQPASLRARMPAQYGRPASAPPMSFMSVGTPANAPASGAAAALRPSSNARWITEPSCGSSRSMRPIAASTSSRGDTSRRRTRSAWAVASSAAKASGMAIPSSSNPTHVGAREPLDGGVPDRK
jgi:hypothetical protein